MTLVILCKLSGSHSGVTEDSSLLGCDTVAEWVGYNNSKVFCAPSLRVKRPEKNGFWSASPLMIGHHDLLKFREWHAQWQCCNLEDLNPAYFLLYIWKLAEFILCQCVKEHVTHLVHDQLETWYITSDSHFKWYLATIAYLKACLHIRYIHIYFYWWMG